MREFNKWVRYKKKYQATTNSDHNKLGLATSAKFGQ